MDINQEIEKLAKYNFSQKDAVEYLLEKGFSKEEIKAHIFKYYEKKDSNPGKPSSSFIISSIGQIILILGMLGFAFTEVFGLVIIAIIFIILTVGFWHWKRYCVVSWIVIFIVAAILCLVCSFISAEKIFFPIALICSVFARHTYTVFEKIEINAEQYDF